MNHRFLKLSFIKIASVVIGFLIVSCLRGQSDAGQVAGSRLVAKPKTFFYQLTTKCTTSAGIYNIGNVLIRTLWAQKTENAGRHTFTWDGLDDLGNAIPDAKYTWKVLTNNVKYTWLGVIGNTSDSLSGRTKHHGYSFITTMCFTGSSGFYGDGYNEGISCTLRIDTSTVGKKMYIMPVDYGLTPSTLRNCTDGNYVYWVSYNFYTSSSFLFATKVSDNSMVSFPQGNSQTVNGRFWYNCLSYQRESGMNGWTGIVDLCVQRTGNYLYFTRPTHNLLYVADKRTGALIDSVTINRVNRICVDASDNYLWINHDSTINERYHIGSNGRLSRTGTTITSNDIVRGMSINNTNTLLAICEAGASQLIKFYNPVTGTFIRSYGKRGGYITAQVTNDKFAWRGDETFISFTPNGTFWVGDYGNNRAMHFDTNFNLINQIAWIPVSYNCWIDYNNPSRVFSDMHEYGVDWNRVATSGVKDSWRLIENWSTGIQSNQYDKYKGLITPLTFSNGHTFCLLPTKLNGPNWQLVELKKDGTKDFTGILIPSSWYLDKSGDLYSQTRSFLNQPIVWSKKTFTGIYDNDGRPIWSSPVVIQTSPVQSTVNEPGYQGNGISYRPNCITEDSVFVAFSASTTRMPGYHLGGVKKGKWIFKTALATSTNYNGNFPTGERFDIGNGVKADGTVCVPLGKTIIWGYNGEFWKASETNMFTQTYSNGLVVNQFGVATARGGSDRGQNAYPMDAGNEFGVQVFTVDGTSFLIHSDEGVHSGIHVWKITGMNTIKLLSGNLSQ